MATQWRGLLAAVLLSRRNSPSELIKEREDASRLIERGRNAEREKEAVCVFRELNSSSGLREEVSSVSLCVTLVRKE